MRATLEQSFGERERGARVRYRRTLIEIESPEQLGYSTIRNNLAESSFSDMRLADYGVEADLGSVLLPYGDHLGAERLRTLIAKASAHGYAVSLSWTVPSLLSFSQVSSVLLSVIVPLPLSV